MLIYFHRLLSNSISNETIKNVVLVYYVQSSEHTCLNINLLTEIYVGVNEKKFVICRMSRYREWDPSCKVYVGNLGNSASKHEIESAFSKYGPLRNVWVARKPPGFAFVEFEDPRDAEDAVRGLDGTYVYIYIYTHTYAIINV